MHRKLSGHIVSCAVRDNGSTPYANGVFARVCTNSFNIQTGDSINISINGKYRLFKRGDSVYVTVIDNFVRFCLYGNLILSTAVVHRQVPVKLCDIVVFCFSPCVEGIAEVVGTCTGERSLAGDIIHCTLTYSKSVTANRYGILHQGQTIVNLFGIARGQRNITTCDLHCALSVIHCKLIGDIVAVRILDNGIADHGDRIITCVGPLRFGTNTLNRILDTIDRKIEGGEAGHRLFGAVILEFTAVGNYKNLILRLCGENNQLTKRGGDNIVVGISPHIERIREGVIALTGKKLGAGHIIRCTFTVSEACTDDGDRAVCQRCTIVELAVFRRNKSQAAFVDLQHAVVDVHDKLACYIVA